MLKVFYWSIGILIALYLIVVCSLFFLQESLIFQDEELGQDYVFGFQSNFEELILNTKDGGTLNAIHFKVKNPKGIIVYFHGNAGDLSRWGNVAEQYLTFNQDVLILDYRGYGKSRGKRTAKKMYADANFVYKEATKLFSESQITVYGRSLGCTFATYAAAKNNPKQLILETPFYSLQSIVSGRYPILPSFGLLSYRFPTYEFINQVNSPITFFHGTNDFVVPYENGKRLFELSSNANLITIPNGGHNDLGDYPKYWNEIEILLK